MENNEITKINERIAVLENQSAQLSSLLAKLETTIDRLGEVSGSLNKFIAIHDHRLEQAEKREQALNENLEFRRRESDIHIDSIERSILKIQTDLHAHAQREEAMFQDINVDITSLKSRVSTLEKWRWIIVGGIGVAVFVIELFAK